jgi:hypothetical protein
MVLKSILRSMLHILIGKIKLLTKLVSFSVLTIVGGAGLLTAQSTISSRVTNEKYPVTVEIPEGWYAQIGINKIIPVDTWTIAPKRYFETWAKGADSFYKDRDAMSLPWISFSVSWLPRSGRHSAGFPGGLESDATEGELLIGKKVRAGIWNGKSRFMTDWNVSRMALSVNVSVPKKNDWKLVRQILDSFAINRTVNPPKSIEYQALKVVEKFAHENDFCDANIVIIPSGSTKTPLMFTIFHSGFGKDKRAGLVSVEVDRKTFAVKADFKK